MSQANLPDKVEVLARAGLTAKGAVYCLIGILAFMAAFDLGAQSSSNADAKGAFQFIQNQIGGKILLGMVAVGLLCYSLWRGVQAILDVDEKGRDKKGLAQRARYLYSGLVYLAATFFAFKMLFNQGGSDGGSNTKQTLIQEVLSKSYGEWVIGFIALLIAAAGIYQIYYGLSEKYREHVDDKDIKNGASSLLLRSGKIGYTSRGVVYIIIAWMLLQAAVHSNSSEAGNTAEAMGFLKQMSYGSYLLGAMGLGLVCYGIFNFIWARYESFD